jgi:hypothetical protein
VSDPTGTGFVDMVRKVLGDEYVYGAAGPSTFDCSGLVQWAAHQVGITAPRTSEAQWAWVQKISKAELQPGDLVFTQWPGDNASPGHVQVYVGNGNVIGADTTDVEQVPLSGDAGHVVGYGRIPGISGAAAASAGGGLLSLALPADVLDMFSQAETVFTKLLWVLNPENAARVVAAVAGAFLALFGVAFLIAAGT